MYVDSLTCVIVKVGESERFRKDSGGETGLHHVPFAFNVYIDGLMKEVKKGMGRR